MEIMFICVVIHESLLKAFRFIQHQFKLNIIIHISYKSYMKNNRASHFDHPSTSDINI